MTPGAIVSRLSSALEFASDTRYLRLGHGVLASAPRLLRASFGPTSAVIIADERAFPAAAKRLAEILRCAGIDVPHRVMCDGDGRLPESGRVDRIQGLLAGSGAAAVAVGSVEVNDLTKLAAHRCGRPYMAVVTDASTDGYTAPGASIGPGGHQRSSACRGPRALIGDLDVIAAAPPELNAAGYAGLLAKITAGADWILADALGLEPIDGHAWRLVQDPLRTWIGVPEGVRAGKASALEALLEGLLTAGLAAQGYGAARPGWGAEHDLCRFWALQHEAEGLPFSAQMLSVATLAVTLLYEQFLSMPIERLDVDAVMDTRADAASRMQNAVELHQCPQLRAALQAGILAKYRERPELRGLLHRLKAIWPELRKRLRGQLIPSRALRLMLQQAGAPIRPEQIGLTLGRVRTACSAAGYMGEGITVLDVAEWTGLLPVCLDRLFAEDGPWMTSYEEIA